MEVCQQNVTFYEQNLNLLSSSVTCDDSWNTHYDPESKQQSDVWNQKGSPPPWKFCTALLLQHWWLILWFQKHFFFSIRYIWN